MFIVYSGKWDSLIDVSSIPMFNLRECLFFRHDGSSKPKGLVETK